MFRRGRQAPPASAAADVDVSDSPESLRKAIRSLNQFINASAGKLPVAATVTARRITDVLAEIVQTSDVRPLDVYAVLSVKGAVADYLPTTLHSFLAVDEALVETPRASGRTPAQSLLEQLDALESSAVTVLSATQQQDVDTLMTQGRFLQTKFTRSDLDL